jgi:hypothetical protein
MKMDMIRLGNDTVRKGGDEPLIGVKFVAPKYFPPKNNTKTAWN